MTVVIVVTVTPGRKPRAALHHEQKLIGNIVILGPGNIIVETQDGRRDRFRTVETCARFCGIPTSEKIKLDWRADRGRIRLLHTG